MKKILSMAALALTSVVMFTACEDDRDSNPSLTQPTSFVLNKPAVGEGVVDLAQSSAISLSWSQPEGYTDMEAPLVATYSIQLSTKPPLRAPTTCLQPMWPLRSKSSTVGPKRRFLPFLNSLSV